MDGFGRDPKEYRTGATEVYAQGWGERQGIVTPQPHTGCSDLGMGPGHLFVTLTPDRDWELVGWLVEE